MSCNFCLAPNNENVILEYVSGVVSAIILILFIVFGPHPFFITCYVIAVAASAFGILALKREVTEFGRVAATLAVINSIMFMILGFLTVIGLPIAISNTRLLVDDQATDEQVRVHKATLGGLVIFIVWIVFGIVTSLCLSIKHIRRCKNYVRNNNRKCTCDPVSTAEAMPSIPPVVTMPYQPPFVEVPRENPPPYEKPPPYDRAVQETYAPSPESFART